MSDISAIDLPTVLYILHITNLCIISHCQLRDQVRQHLSEVAVVAVDVGGEEGGDGGAAHTGVEH